MSEFLKRAIANALFPVGHVVTTPKKVRCFNRRTSKPDGWALPGWKWKIVKILADHKGEISYECIDNSGGLYKATIKEKDINYSAADVAAAAKRDFKW